MQLHYSGTGLTPVRGLALIVRDLPRVSLTLRLPATVGQVVRTVARRSLRLQASKLLAVCPSGVCRATRDQVSRAVARLLSRGTTGP